MDLYLFNTEVVRFAFVLGIVVAILLYERLHLTTGSIIVPGYVGICILEPTRIGMMTVNALVAFWLVHRALPHLVLMGGRAKLFATIAVSVSLETLWRTLDGPPHAWGTAGHALLGIGYVVPGLIAHEMSRHGVGKTAASVLGAGLVVGVVVFGITVAFPGLRAHGGPAVAAAFPVRWMPLALLCGALSSSALQHARGLKAGGFVGAAYLAFILVDPVQLVWLLALTPLTYVVTTRLVMPRLILFGRRKYATMLLVGAALSWTTLVVLEDTFGQNALPLSSPSFAIMSVVMIGLFANDLERVGFVRVLKGTALCVTFTLSATLLATELYGPQRADVVGPLALLLLIAAAIIFGPYAAPLLHRTAAAADRARWQPTRAGIPVIGPRLGVAAFAAAVFVVGNLIGALPLLREAPLFLVTRPPHAAGPRTLGRAMIRPDPQIVEERQR